MKHLHSAFRIPHSAFRSLHSAFRIPHSAFRSLGFVLALLVLGYCSPAPALTMPDAVERALVNNLELRAKRRDLDRARAELIQAGALPNPTIRYEYVSSWTKEASATTDPSSPTPILGKPLHVPITPGKITRFATLAIGGELEIGLQRGLRKRVAHVEIERVRAEIEDAERTLSGRVKHAFLDAAYLDRARSLADTAVYIGERLAEIARARFDAGEASELEVKLARLEAMRARTRRAETVHQLALARIELHQLMGQTGGKSVDDLETPSRWWESLELSLLTEEAWTRRPDLIMANLGARKATQETRLARRDRIPDLQVSLVYERLSGTNLYGGHLSLPLPVLNRNRGAIEIARARKRRFDTESTYLRERIRREVEAAFERLGASKERLDLFEEGILDLAAGNLELTRTRYRFGEIDIFGVIRAQERFVEAQSTYLETRHAFDDALAELETVVAKALREDGERSPLARGDGEMGR